MSKHDLEALCRLETEAGVLPNESDRDAAANDNSIALVETWPDGDPHVFARALARVLVRQVLRELRATPSDDACQPKAVVG
jgi:hypothetical protein